MKLFFLRNLSILGLLIFSASCTTIIKGRYQEVSFQSVPESATVTIDGRIIGKTPLTANLKKQSGQAVIFEKDGYKPITMSLETRMSGWFWGNIVFGGLIGSTTDGATGAVQEYSPSQYMITLQPITSNPLSSDLQRPKGDRMKSFIIAGYSNIRTDLNSGSGPYVSSLLELLNVPKEKSEDATKTLKLLAIISRPV